jgi:hypothetical protein
MNGHSFVARPGIRRITVMMTAMILMITAGTARAQEHRLECPRVAPPEWGLPRPALLEQAAVLFQPTGEPIDENSPPSLVPDRGYARENVWHNIWLMGDELGWSHFIDCRYRGSTRVLRLQADGLKQCEQAARPSSIKGGVPDNAVQTMVCR